MSARNAVAEEDYRLKLVEAQWRSEERMRKAALALAADKLARAAAAGPPSGSLFEGRADRQGALTARF